MLNDNQSGWKQLNKTLDRQLRKFMATMFPGRFPMLYSTLDNPIAVPVQVAAYKLAVSEYIQPGDKVLDVGFGLGFGFKIMAEKAAELSGIEIDRKAVASVQNLVSERIEICEARHYDGVSIPYGNKSFDVVTCIDVLEHVPDYLGLIKEMVGVSRRIILLSTPNRRLEYTRADGSPKNRWHLREWSYEELDSILSQTLNVQVEWNFLNGSWSGPFEKSSVISEDTLALTPALNFSSATTKVG